MQFNRVMTFTVPLVTLLAVTGCSFGGTSGVTNQANSQNAVGNQTIDPGGGIANTVSDNTSNGAGHPASKTPYNLAVNKGFMPTAVQIIDAKQAFIAAGNGLYETIDGGRDWTLNWSGKGQILKLDFENGVDAFALVDKGQTKSGHLTDLQLWHTTDGGTTWSEIADQSQMGLSSVPSNSRFQVSFHSRAVGIITIAPRGVSSQPVSALKTTDGGTHWTRAHIPPQTAAVDFPDPKTGYALARTGTNYRVEKTTDGGDTWRMLKSTSVTRLMSARIQTYGNTVWVMAVRGQNMYQASYVLYRSTDGGGRWKTIIDQNNAVQYGSSSRGSSQPLAKNGPGTIPTMLDPVSKTSAILLGASPARGQGESQIAKITSNRVNVLHHYFPGTKGWVLFLNHAAGWVVTAEQGQPTQVYLTNNGGASWHLKSRFVPSG